MWSDRKQENFSSRGSLESETGGAPVVESAGRVLHVTIIGKAMTIRGTIRSEESLHVDGEIEGKLDLLDHRLTVGPQGTIKADTKAREVEILGRLDGDIDAAGKVTVRKGGRLVGDLRTPAIVIEDGAYFKGRIEITNPEERPQIIRPPVTTKKTAAGA